MEAWTMVAYILEILLAELIFLYPAQRRPRFALRYASACLACLVLALLVPSLWPYPSQLSDFLRFMLLFSFTAIAMGFSFRLPVPALIASCVAGYAVEHITFHFTKLMDYAGFMAGASLLGLPRKILTELAAILVIYPLFYLTMGRFAAKKGYYKRADLRFDLLSIAIILICIGLTRASNYFGDSGSVTVSLYAITACFMALMVQLVLNSVVNLEREQETMQLLWQEERKQYELSKKTIDTINIKYHDLKHKLRSLSGHLPEEEIESIQTAVKIYGSQIKTGSEALDVLLTENSLRCTEEGITMTFTGRGTDLSFVKIMDIYSLFGNAISNAMEAAERLDDPEKKVIDIMTQRVGEMIVINITNFFTGELKLKDGIPVTSKTAEEGFHGYGMRSMCLIAEKYGGRLTVSAEGDLFTLNIYLLQG